MKKLAITLLVAVVVANALGLGFREGYLRFQDVKARAYAAEAHLRTAENELRVVSETRDLGQFVRVRDEFAAARAEFAHINREVDALGPLYSLFEAFPRVGDQARAARKLMRAGEQVSRAGEEASLAAAALAELGRQRSDAQNIELLMFVLPVATDHLSAALEAIHAARDEYEELPEDGLDPLLGSALNRLRSSVPKQQSLVNRSLDVLRALPRILGSDEERTYLLLVQDAAELRPTGGFIGNYGIIRFRQGRMVEVVFDDSYRADWPYYYSGKASPPIGMFSRYFPESTFWGLRDSNIWPDFERSAKQAAWFAVEEGLVERVDGVIAITDDIVQPLMKVVGPVTVPEYGETVDEGNVLDRIRFYQMVGLSEDQARSLGVKSNGNRKHFTSLVLSEIVARINNLDVPGLIELSMSLEGVVRGKGLQLYFSDPGLQKLVEDNDLAGQFKPATGDYLWVSDMNLTPSKDNLYVRPSIAYSVTLADSGAIGELVLTYDYSQGQGERYTGTIGRSYHGNYVRVYLPPGATLLGEEGTEEPVEIYYEMGKTVFGNFVKVQPGSLRKVKLRYWQPLKIWYDGERAVYELVVQKQAGNNAAFEARVSLPKGAVLEDPGLFARDGPFLLYRGPLRADTRLAATFSMP